MTGRVPLFFYNFFGAFFLLLAGVPALLNGRWRRGLRERLCLAAPPDISDGGKCLWVHGASVGESRIAVGLARRIRAERPDLAVALSAYTPAGRALLPDPPTVSAAFFIPLDFAGGPTRVLRALRPAVLVLIGRSEVAGLVSSRRWMKSEPPAPLSARCPSPPCRSST